MIIGVTDESVELVDKWVKENEPGYPIVILADSSVEDALGVAYFPTAAVIDPEGKIIFAGSAGEYSSPLKKAMGDAEKGSVIPKVFSKFNKYLKAGNTGKAYDTVMGMLESGKLEGSELSWGRKLQTWLEGEAATALNEGKAKLEAGWVYLARKEVEGLDDSKVGYPNLAEVNAFIEQLEALENFKDEMKAGELYEDVKAELSEWEFGKAVKSYKQIYTKYSKTRIAAHARAAAEEIVNQGLPGIKKSCDNCRRKRQACSKHEESVKL